MTQKELKKLNKTELLELLAAQGHKISELEEENKKLKEQITSFDSLSEIKTNEELIINKLNELNQKVENLFQPTAKTENEIWQKKLIFRQK